MIYRTEQYKEYTIHFRKANEATIKRQSIVSFKITKESGFDKATGCYWCQGKWWKNEDYARFAAHTMIDRSRIFADAGLISSNKKPIFSNR